MGEPEYQALAVLAEGVQRDRAACGACSARGQRSDVLSAPGGCSRRGAGLLTWFAALQSHLSGGELGLGLLPASSSLLMNGFPIWAEELEIPQCDEGGLIYSQGGMTGISH